MRRAVIGRVPATVVSVLVLVLAALALAPGATAQSGLTITTPFPSVSVQPGGSVTFALTLRATATVRVDLSVDGLPEGWTYSFSGGGNEVRGALVQAGDETEVSLTVEVPEDAGEEPTTLTVVGTAGDESARLQLDLVPAAEAGGTVALESDYPSIRGSTDEEFQFNLTLHNDTPQQLIFGLSATGPAGWEVSVQPTGQARAASVTVDARAEQRLEVTATAPGDAQAGTYPIVVQATADGHQAAAELAVEVTGSVAMALVAEGDRLNTTANAGSTREFQVTVVNEGTSPLADIQLTGTGPTEWEITFDPPLIEQLAPDGSAPATASITPSGNAVAGDYVVELSASAEGADETIQVRVTVETPPIWGIIGLLLIAGTLAGMVWVFRRYGRR